MNPDIVLFDIKLPSILLWPKSSALWRSPIPAQVQRLQYQILNISKPPRYISNRTTAYISLKIKFQMNNPEKIHLKEIRLAISNINLVFGYICIKKFWRITLVFIKANDQLARVSLALLNYWLKFAKCQHNQRLIAVKFLAS